MKSIKFINGDLSFNYLGKLEFVEDDEQLIQTIGLLFKTEKGDIFYNDEYGVEKIRGKITEESVTEYISKGLENESRIADFNIISFEKKRDGVANIHIEFIKADNETLELDVEMEI